MVEKYWRFLESLIYLNTSISVKELDSFSLSRMFIVLKNLENVKMSEYMSDVQRRIDMYVLKGIDIVNDSKDGVSFYRHLFDVVSEDDRSKFKAVIKKEKIKKRNFFNG